MGDGGSFVVAYNLYSVVKAERASIAVELDDTTDIILPVKRIDGNSHWPVGCQHFQQIFFRAHIAKSKQQKILIGMWIKISSV